MAHAAAFSKSADGELVVRVPEGGIDPVWLALPLAELGLDAGGSFAAVRVEMPASRRWSTPDAAFFARVLRDALSQRLDASRVLVAGERRIPDVDLTVEFLALDPQGGVLHLDARWFFSCTAEHGSRAGRSQLDVPLAAATPGAVAAATTEALARLADALADEIPTECRPFADDLAGRRR